MRLAGSLALALVIVLGLFWLMQRMIQPDADAPVAPRDIEAIQVVEAAPEPETPEEAAMEAAELPPAPPTPSLSRPDLPSLNLPAPASAPIDAGPITLPAIVGAGAGLGSSLSGSRAFGGFAGRGGGGGGQGGGGGFGKGEGFKGKPLIPLSTARPQMPDWACKQGIRGWVEVVFTVLPNGRVTDVKLVDADPRGVFEAAAIESVSHWLYQSHGKARTVKQRVDMNPEDCVYNWDR